MYIELDLKSRECDVMGAKCAHCKEEKRTDFLRIVSIELGCHSIGSFVLCIKCLSDKYFSVRK